MCPRAVRAAHRFAMASDRITGDAVEISEFPHLAVKYDAQMVPTVVINDQVAFQGPKSEQEFVREILKMIGK